MPNPLVGEIKVSQKQVEDLVLREWDPRFSRTSVEVDGPITLKVGTVLVDAPASASAIGTQQSFSDSLCLENVTIPDGETREVKALVRGPALVNIDEVERINANETDAARIIRLADLVTQNVRFVRQPIHTTDSGRD